MLKLAVIVFGVLAVAQAQRGGAPRGRSIDDDRVATTPVPILRQINKVNEDGSYTYGYESADGSYKVETKTAAGEVQGKYGYYDDTGALREIEYGASRQGFQPQGTDVRRPSSAPAMAYDPNDDTGFYDPELYERPFAYNRANNQIQPEQQQQQPARRPAASGRRPGGRRPKAQQNFAQFNQFPSAPAPAPAPAPQPQHQHVVNYSNVPQHQPAPQQQQYYQPPPQNYYQPQPQAPAFNPSSLFNGHPARNIDINTGSYSVNYSG